LLKERLVAGGWWLVAGAQGAVRTSVTLLVQDIGNTVTFLCVSRFCFLVSLALAC
jgi:hypothetical protein